MGAAALPHRHPFRLLDEVDAAAADQSAGRARLRLTAGGAIGRGSTFPPILAIEILAQAAMTVLADGGGEGVGYGYLAAADEVELAPALGRRPLAPGDDLTAAITRTGAFGRLLKVRGELLRDDRTVATASLTLALPRSG